MQPSAPRGLRLDDLGPASLRRALRHLLLAAALLGGSEGVVQLPAANRGLFCPRLEPDDREHAQEADQHEQGEDLELRRGRQAADQHHCDDGVQGQAVQVVHGPPDALRNDVGFQHAHRREVHAATQLEEQEAEDQQPGVEEGVGVVGRRIGHDSKGDNPRPEAQQEAHGGGGVAAQQRRRRGATHASHHEHREQRVAAHLLVEDGEMVHGRPPGGHENEHGALENRHDTAEEHEHKGLGPVVRDGLQVIAAAAGALAAIVLVEEAHDEDHGDHQAHDRGVERIACPAPMNDAALVVRRQGCELLEVAAHEAGDDAHDVHGAEHEAEHVAQEPA
mmetsp:Transcript_2348/g.4961  ORF Transcript_2348/g.4961 Transcript_2348/m.4961 type:complete len:334 (+) Transcript_2348:29-1030(+)